MKTSRKLLIDQHPFSKGHANIAITPRDLAGLKVLVELGGIVSNPAGLAKAMTGGAEDSQHSMTGGRLIRRLESYGFIREGDKGFEITVTGRAAATRA